MTAFCRWIWEDDCFESTIGQHTHTYVPMDWYGQLWPFSADFLGAPCNTLSRIWWRLQASEVAWSEEWKGPWSDGSSNWTEEARKEFHVKKDGLLGEVLTLQNHPEILAVSAFDFSALTLRPFLSSLVFSVFFGGASFRVLAVPLQSDVMWSPNPNWP